MKAVEIKYRAIESELEKLNARLEKAKKSYEKKLATAKKYGVDEWTNADRRAWLQTVPREGLFIANKADAKKNGAWMDLDIAKDNIEELQQSIKKAEARLEKADKQVEEYRKEVEQIEDLKRKEELQKLEFEQEQKEWKKDGITLEGRYHGTTPSGKKFLIYGNGGYHKRSLHCFTLYIDGETIFTSGEFWRAYKEIKNR